MNANSIRKELVEVLENNILDNYNEDIRGLNILKENKDILECKIGINVPDLNDKIEEIENNIKDDAENLAVKVEDLISEIEDNIDSAKGQQKNSFNNFKSVLDDILLKIRSDDIDEVIEGLERCNESLIEEKRKIKPVRPLILSDEEGSRYLIMESRIKEEYDTSCLTSSELHQFTTKLLKGDDDFTENELFCITNPKIK